MTDIVPLAGSAGVKNPALRLFQVPPTDLSMASYRMVPIHPFTTGINPIDFQIDPQEDYVDLSRSYFEIELSLKKAGGGNVVADENTFLVNNIGHSLFKQISVRLNNTLISPQTDTYHYKAYLETLLNFNRDDGETILKPQGWVNYVNWPNARTANQLNVAGPHADFEALAPKDQTFVRDLRGEITKYAAGVTRTLIMVPHIEVFHLSKLLIPQVQIGIQMYFNPVELWSLRYAGAVAFRLDPADVKVKLYLCQVRLNPSVYRELMSDMTKQIVSYPTVRSEIRTYNIARNTLHYEINNPFQNRLPNMVIVGLVASTAFNGAVGENPFSFRQFQLVSVKQVVRGETYPYEPLVMMRNNGSKDMRGYRQFLQATGSLCKSRGNMVQADDWGNGKNCTLFVFENAANGCLNSPVLNPKLSGELRLVLAFGGDQGANVTAIVYGEFENLLEINPVKAVQYDVYQT